MAQPEFCGRARAHAAGLSPGEAAAARLQGPRHGSQLPHQPPLLRGEALVRFGNSDHVRVCGNDGG